MFHKEGFKIILVSFAITVIIALIAHYCIDIEWLKLLVQLVAFVFLIAILQFFRNPKRLTPKNDAHIIAPVDGKVVVIEEVFEKEYFKDKRLQVSIFMSPLNVHVTRYALGGKVTYSKYHPGNYAKVGDTAVQGEDAGFIKFGSRVDVYLPLGTKVKVQLGDKVKGGVQVIAEK